MGRKNRLAILGLAAGLLGGGVAGLALTSPGVASGQASTTTTTTKDHTSRRDARDAYLRQTLAPLVKNGTITQKQADAVIKALEDAKPAHPFGEGKFRGGRMLFGDAFGAVAKKLGVSEDALRTELRNGKSIADIAREKHVDPAAVVDAVVAAIKADVDQAVKDGKLSQAEADQRMSAVRQHITAFVNGKLPRLGAGRGSWFRPGRANWSQPEGQSA